MTHILDSFLYFWYYWMFISFGLGILGFILVFIYRKENAEKHKKRFKRGLKLFVQVIVTWIIGFGSMFYIQYSARNEVLCFLDQNNLSININSKNTKEIQKEKLLYYLKQLKYYSAHNSSYELGGHTTIKNNGDSIKLMIYQDSENKNEFWVFCDKYNTTKSKEIGRIRLDDNQSDSLLNLITPYFLKKLNQNTKHIY